MRTMRALNRDFLIAVALMAGCGGGAATTEGGGAAVGPGGAPIRGANGAVIPAAVHNKWLAASELFARYEGSGWNESQCEQVAEAFEEVADAQASFAEAFYMAGLAKQRCGKAEEAQAFFQKALRANSKLCKARVAIGLDHVANGRESQGEREFAASIQADPQCTEGYVNLAILQRAHGGAQVAEALNNLRRALAIDAQYLPAFNEMALLYLSEAASNKKKLDLAEVVCSQAQKINANYAPVYNTWGLINLQRDDIIAASAKFRRAFELDPKMYEAYMNFAQITLGFRGYEDARNAFAKALELQPRSYEAQLGLAIALRGLEQKPQAEAAYMKAKELQPNRPETYYDLGVLYQDFMSGTAEDMNKAKAFYDQFVSRAGNAPEFATAVAEINRKCKRKPSSGRRRRRLNTDTCVAGRRQNIDEYLGAMSEMAQMQREQEEMEREAAAMQRQQEQQQQSAPPSEAPATP